MKSCFGRPQSGELVSTIDGIMTVMITLLVLIENVIVLVLLWRFRAFQTPTNIFIACMSIADIFVALIPLPLYFTFYVLPWQPPSSWRLTYYISDNVSSTISITSLSILAFDRYFIIVHPFIYERRMNINIALTMGIIIFIYGACVGALGILLSDTAFALFILIAVYAVPSSAIFFCHINVAIIAKRHAKKILKLQVTKSPVTSIKRKYSVLRKISRGKFGTEKANKVSVSGKLTVNSEIELDFGSSTNGASFMNCVSIDDQDNTTLSKDVQLCNISRSEINKIRVKVSVGYNNVVFEKKLEKNQENKSAKYVSKQNKKKTNCKTSFNDKKFEKGLQQNHEMSSNNYVSNQNEKETDFATTLDDKKLKKGPQQNQEKSSNNFVSNQNKKETDCATTLDDGKFEKTSQQNLEKSSNNYVLNPFEHASNYVTSEDNEVLGNTVEEDQESSPKNHKSKQDIKQSIDTNSIVNTKKIHRKPASIFKKTNKKQRKKKLAHSVSSPQLCQTQPLKKNLKKTTSVPTANLQRSVTGKKNFQSLVKKRMVTNRQKNIIREEVMKMVQQVRRLRIELKATILLTVVMVIFLCLWTPYGYVNGLLLSGKLNCAYGTHIQLTKYFKLLHYVNAVINPIYYVLLNSKLRNACKTLFSNNRFTKMRKRIRPQIHTAGTAENRL